MTIIDLHISTFIVLYALIVLIAFICTKKKKNKRFKFGFYIISIFYWLLLIKTTLLPIAIMKHGQVEGFKNAVGKYTTLQFIPFKTIIGNFSSTTGLIQLFGNIILLIPIAIFLKYLAKRNYSDIKIIITVCICSVAI